MSFVINRCNTAVQDNVALAVRCYRAATTQYQNCSPWTNLTASHRPGNSDRLRGQAVLGQLKGLTPLPKHF